MGEGQVDGAGWVRGRVDGAGWVRVKWMGAGWVIDRVDGGRVGER